MSVRHIKQTSWLPSGVGYEPEIPALKLPRCWGSSSGRGRSAPGPSVFTPDTHEAVTYQSGFDLRWLILYEVRLVDCLLTPGA